MRFAGDGFCCSASHPANSRLFAAGNALCLVAALSGAVHSAPAKPNRRSFSTLLCSRFHMQCRRISSSPSHSYKVANAVSDLGSLFVPVSAVLVIFLRLFACIKFHALLLRKVVVGGSSGIGFSVCEEFLRSGAKVLSLSRSATAACGAQHVPCDLNSHSSIAEAADAVSAVYGRSPTPITLILNAGHGKSDSARSVTQESLMQHLNINVVSQVRRRRQEPPTLLS